MKGFVLLLLSAILLALGTLGWAQTKAAPAPPAAATGPKPFLSAVSKIITPPGPSPTPFKFVSQYASPTPTPVPSASAGGSPVKPVVRFRPTKDGVEEPFYDVPWAVHIPIEVPFEGGGARITWQARVSWENAPQEWPQQSANLVKVGGGIYRLDGKRLDQNAIRRGSSAFKWEQDAPLPTYIWDATYSSAFGGEKDKHKPMAGLEDDAIVIEPVLPGWYTMWFAFDASTFWPEKEPKREFLAGTIHFDCMVSRGVEEPTSAEKEYLFGRGKRPDKMQDDKFYVVKTIDVPFKLRRDSWEFDHGEVHMIDDDRKKLAKKRVRYGDNSPSRRIYSNYAVSEKVSGKGIELNLTEKIQASPRGEITEAETPDNDSAFDTVYIWDEKWKASFPPSLADNSFGSVQFSGGREGHYQQKGLGTSASGSYPRWDPSGPWVVKPPYYQSNEWIKTVRYPLAKDAQSWEKKAKDDLVNNYGKDALEWFTPDYFEDYEGAGVKKSEAPAQYVIRSHGPRVPDAAPLELGSYPLVAFHVGPWEICGFYRRLSEIENRTVPNKEGGGDTTIVSDEDKFWEWYVELVKVLEEQLPIATEAEVHGIQEGTPLQSLIKSRNHLLLSLQGDNEPVTHGLGQIWNAKDKAWEWLDNTLPQLDLGTMPGGSEPGSVNTPVKASPEMAQRIQKKVGELTKEISEHRKNISQDTDKARGAYQKINDKLEEGNKKFGGPEHGELYLWRQHYQKILEQLPIRIALASNDPEILKRALDEASKQGASAETCVLEAELYKAGGDAISSLDALRRAVRLDKDHMIAQQMLADLECSFLQCAIEKSQGAIAQARHYFYGYLAERGFSDRDVLASATKPLDWMSTRIGIYSEEAWAMFTTGLFGSFSAFYGKPAAEADMLATKEREMTTAFIGLHTMRLLRKKGVTFDEMRKLTSSEVRDKLGMRARDGQPLSDADAANIRVAIREAMMLPDVQGLIKGDSNLLREGIKEGYWDPKDVNNTWIEYFGDLTSAYNLFTLLLPGAKVGTEGRTMNPLVWTQAEAKMVGELQALGQITSGTEALASAVGLSRKLNALGASAGGKKVVAFLRGLDRYQSSLGAFDKAVWTTGKITGALTFGYATVSATEKLAGHKAAMLVAAALMFTSDTDLLVKLLEGRNIAPNAIARVIISDYLPATQVHIKRLAATEKTAGELRGLFERVKQGNRLVRADHEFLNKYFGSDWRRMIPGPSPSENATIALLAAGEGAVHEVQNGAIKVIEKLQPELKAEAEAAQQTLQEEQKVTDALSEAKTDPNPPSVEQPNTPVRGPPVVDRPLTSKFGAPIEGVEPPPPPAPRRLPAPPSTPEYPPSGQRVLPVEARAAPELGNYIINPPLRENSETAQAMQSLNNGQYAVAERKFIEIQELIRQGVLTEADEMTMERLHQFRMVANELQGVTRTTVAPGSRSPINDAIPEAIVDEVLGNPGSLKQIKDSSGAMSEVFNVEGHPELFVKRVRRNFERMDTKTNQMQAVEIDVLQDVENNLVHEQLARAIGFDVPAMEVRIIYDADGHALEAYYVMRKVQGRTLLDLKAGEIYLYRDELARHRALSVLIGDYDRKLDNYLITDDGRFVPIDAGVADVTGERLVHECEKNKIAYHPDLPFTIDGCWGRDHWYAKSIAEAPGEEILTFKKTNFRKFLTAEESMTFQGAEPGVKAIEDLFVNGKSAAQAEELLTSAYSKIYVPKGIKRLAELRGVNLADPAVRAALEREVALNLREQIHAAVEKVTNNLKARAPHIRDSMKGLNKRNAIPVFETETSSSSSMHLESDLVLRVVFQHYITNAILRRREG